MAAKALKRVALVAVAATALLGAQPALAQVSVASGVQAGELEVPVNKSQVLRADRPYAKALIGNDAIADIVPITSTSVYVLGKKTGTTSLTLYDRSSNLIAVVDVVVGPDVTTLKRQLSEVVPGTEITARMSNDSVILEGIVPNSVAADRAVQVAETYAPGKVVNLLGIGSARQVMLEVRFTEVKRSALKQIGLNWDVNGNSIEGLAGGGSGVIPTTRTVTLTSPGSTITTSGPGPGQPVHSAITD